MQEEYEKALDKVEIYTKALHSGDRGDRRDAVLNIVSALAPYVPPDILGGVASVLASVVVKPDLWTVADSPIAEILRLTMSKVRLLEHGSVLTAQMEHAILRLKLTTGETRND